MSMQMNFSDSEFKNELQDMVIMKNHKTLQLDLQLLFLTVDDWEEQWHTNNRKVVEEFHQELKLMNIFSKFAFESSKNEQKHFTHSNNENEETKTNNDFYDTIYLISN